MSRYPSRLPLPSLLPKRELLATIPDVERGLICAAYVTGRTTLCGRETAGGEPSGPPPTCPECVRVARLWDAIDGCVPPSWGYMAAA